MDPAVEEGVYLIEVRAAAGDDRLEVERGSSRRG
jgi:hypothetical protein